MCFEFAWKTLDWSWVGGAGTLGQSLTHIEENLNIRAIRNDTSASDSYVFRAWCLCRSYESNLPTNGYFPRSVGTTGALAHSRAGGHPNPRLRVEPLQIHGDEQNSDRTPSEA